MVELSASGLLQGLAESLGYLPIDLGASGHPPPCLASARLWVGLVEALGEPVRENLFGGSALWVFPSAESNGSGANTPRSREPSRLAFPAATRSEAPRWAKDPGRGLLAGVSHLDAVDARLRGPFRTESCTLSARPRLLGSEALGASHGASLACCFMTRRYLIPPRERSASYKCSIFCECLLPNPSARSHELPRKPLRRSSTSENLPSTHSAE